MNHGRADDATGGADPGLVIGLSGDDRADLIARADRMAASLRDDPAVDPVALASEAESEPRRRHRLAVLGDGPSGLADALGKASRRLAEGDRASIRVRGVMSYGAAPDPGRVAFLFPGQGSQYHGMLRGLGRVRPGVRGWFDALDRAYERRGFARVPGQIIGEGAPADDAGPDAALFDMVYGGQIGLVANLALLEVVEDLGLRADVIVGHSNGEHAALYCGDLIEFDGRDRVCEHLVEVALAGRAMARPRVPEGMLAVSGLGPGVLGAILGRQPDPPFLAMDNSPGQGILAGTLASLEAIRGPIAASGGIGLRIPFDRAYHTPLFADWSRLLRGCYEALAVGTPRTPVYSCMTVGPFPGDRGRVLDLTARQWSSPVRFRQVVEHLYDHQGVRTFVEVGPDEKLTAFVTDTLRGRPHLAVGASNRHRDDLAQLRMFAAELFARGLPVRLDRLRPPARVARFPAGTVPGLAPTPDRSGRRPPPARVILGGHAELVELARGVDRRVLDRLRRIAPAASTGPSPASFSTAPERRPRRPGALLGDDVRVESGRLIARRRFDRRDDRFVDDHSLGRRASTLRAGPFPLPVLPFTLSMALAAEAARRLGGGVVAGLSGIGARRWLALDRGHLEVVVEAECVGAGPRDAGGIRVRIFGPDGVSRTPAFEATAHLADSYPVPGPGASEGVPTPRPPGPGRWTAGEFYRRFAFHGPSFQTLHRVGAVTEGGVEAELQVTEIPGLPADGLDLDPAAFDGTGQLVALWLLERGHRDFGIFPFAADSLTLYAPPRAAGSRLRLRGSARLDPAGWTEASFAMVDASGRLVGRLEGLRQRLVRFPAPFARLMLGDDPASAFLGRSRGRGPVASSRLRPEDWGLLGEGGGIWARVLAHLVLGPEELDAWYESGGPDGPSADRLLERVAAKEAARTLLASRGIRLASADLSVPDGRGGAVCRAPGVPVGPGPRLRVARRGGRIVATAWAQALSGMTGRSGRGGRPVEAGPTMAADRR